MAHPYYNYIIIDNKNKDVKIVLEKFKTAKTFKNINIDVDKDLSKDIIKYFKVLSDYKKMNSINNDWFLIHKNGDTLSRNNFTIFLNNIFKEYNKKISSSLIRKIVSSSLYNVPEMKRLEKVMGHNLSTQLKYYVKE